MLKTLSNGSFQTVNEVQSFLENIKARTFGVGFFGGRSTPHGGGGVGVAFIQASSLREIYHFLRLCGIMLWNTKSEIGLQQ